MKTDPVFEQLRESSWRRKLSAAEEAQLRCLLAANPELQAEWQTEAALNETLARLPVPPVPSNFTARVLQEVQRQSRRSPGGRWDWLHWRVRWLPRVAALVLVLGAGLMTYERELVHKQKIRAARLQSLMTVSELHPLANPEIIENFDAIRAMGRTVSADDELIRLLQ